MPSLIDPAALTDEQVELVEKLSARFVYQALRDFALDALHIFATSQDRMTEVAQDTTQEALNRLPGFSIPARLPGTMDFKRAGYTFLPDFAVRQALLVDSKAEKSGGSARIQTSQTSLAIRQMRKEQAVEEVGELPEVTGYRGHAFLVTTLFVHYHYKERTGGGLTLRKITIAALPGRRFQDRYSRSAEDTVFGGSPHKDDEAFRTRLNFSRLETRCPWRVQRLSLDGASLPPQLPEIADEWRE